MHIGIVATVTVLTLAVVSGKVVPNPDAKSEVTRDCPEEATATGLPQGRLTAIPLLTTAISGASEVLTTTTVLLAALLSGFVSGLNQPNPSAAPLLRDLQNFYEFDRNYIAYLRE